MKLFNLLDLQRFCRSGGLSFLLVVAFGLRANDAKSGSLFESCGVLWKEFIRDPDYLQSRALEVLPRILATQKDHWLLTYAQRPEQSYGAQEVEAMQWFQGLSEKDVKTLTRQRIYENQAWGNTVDLYKSGTFGVLLKTNYRRSSFDGEKTHQVSNNIRYEVLAFALDRYLGTNLVPPARFFNDQSSALLLFVPGSRSLSMRNIENDPRHLVRLTHTRYLDELLGNVDRENSENMLLSPQGTAVAIDFDLAQPNKFYSGFNSYLDYAVRVQEPTFEGTSAARRRVYLPGVTAQSVFEKLQALNSDSLNRLAGQVGIVLTEYEQKRILGGKRRILGSIERWVNIYGEEQVILKDGSEASSAAPTLH